MINERKAPFPYFGGKADAAEEVWAALGDVEHYVEPFAGSLAVLLRRPHEVGRTYYSETVNDLDGLLVNAWRAIKLSPDATAEAASWPVIEADLTARHLALVRWRASQPIERLMADPDWHDPKMAGWWIWGASCWIGSGYCSGEGGWVERDGLLARGNGREGVSRKMPHVGDDGKGVNLPQARQPGVARQLPYLSGDGQGVNLPQAREPGSDLVRSEVRRWFRSLSERLRDVRVLNGDWKRALGTSVVRNLSVRSGGVAGVFFDPPYGETRDTSVYAHDDSAVHHAVRAWCIEHGASADLRIVLAGYDTEHEELERHGWRVVEWFKSGFLKGGYSQRSAKQQHRERLWLSPHCLAPEASPQLGLFDATGNERRESSG